MQMLRSYRLLVTWQALRKKSYLPLMLAVQTLFTLGIVLVAASGNEGAKSPPRTIAGRISRERRHG